MVTPELISYLESCRALGVKKEQTMSALLGVGWNLAQVQEGLKIVQARDTPLKKPKYLFPAFQLSFSLLFILVLGTSASVLALNYAKQAPLGNQLQASITGATLPIVAVNNDAALIEEQINTVTTLVDSLEIYKEITGHYPRTLAELKHTGNEIMAIASTTLPEHDRAYIVGLYGSRPLYENDFTDRFTESPFLYGATGDNFSLSYLLRWTTPQSSVIEREFVNGWNTATKESFSALRH
ncbi:MAG: hypothetical protein AAB691_02480 [Patescibacteria group bacterium]